MSAPINFLNVFKLLKSSGWIPIIGEYTILSVDICFVVPGNTVLCIIVSLGLYCLGKSSDTRLEQYSFKDDNINIMDLILNQFNIMNIELQGLGNICPKEKIDEYNRKVLHNLQ